MIERYSRPQMKLVWSDQNKYDKWLTIEIAVCEAWTQKGLIPEEEMVKLRSATYDFELFQDILMKTKHDMTAFLQSTTAGLGDEGRWLHQGLTTSDVWDTATSLQLVEAGSLGDKELILLETAGATVDFFDPYVADIVIDNKTKVGLTELTAENLQNYDSVAILTDHTNVDYELVKKQAALIIDTRNVYPINHDKKIIRLGVGQKALVSVKK